MDELDQEIELRVANQHPWVMRPAGRQNRHGAQMFAHLRVRLHLSAVYSAPRQDKSRVLRVAARLPAVEDKPRNTKGQGERICLK